MLPLKKNERVRMVAAVSSRGAAFTALRTVVITLSLAILVAIPMLGVVRMDLWQGQHLLLGEEVDFLTAFQGFIVALAILYGGTFVSNMVVGRFFCGWGCPVGYVSRFGENVANAKSRVRKLLHHASGAAFVATFIGAVMLWWVDPMVMIEGSMQARLVVLGVFAALWAGGFGHAFMWRFGFCVSVCPIGLYYRLVTSKAPVGIVFNEVPNPCIECGACEKICPVAIDPKALGQPMVEHATSVDEEPERYGDAECIRCGDCVEACRMVFSSRDGETPPLRFGRIESQDEESKTEGGAPAEPEVDESSHARSRDAAGCHVRA